MIPLAYQSAHRRRAAVAAGSYLNLPGGSTGAYATTHHGAGYYAGPHVDAAWLIAPTTWLVNTRRAFGGQWTLAWFLEQVGGGSFRFFFRNATTGTDQALSNLTVPPWADGEMRWLRVQFTPDNGLNQKELRLSHGDPTLAYEDVVWTQLGATTVAATAGTVGTSTASFGCGGATSSIVHVGRMYEHVFRSTIDGPILTRPKFHAQTPGTTSFTDDYGRVWTMNGGSSIVAE